MYVRRNCNLATNKVLEVLFNKGGPMKLIIVILDPWEINSISHEKDDLATTKSLFSLLSRERQFGEY
jgi:hypothetical protein